MLNPLDNLFIKNQEKHDLYRICLMQKSI